LIGLKKVTAIILIAGNSTRFGTNGNKNFEKINGKYVFEYSLEAFLDNEYVDNIIVAIKKNERDLVEQILVNVTKEIKVIIGGNTRKESVYNCLRETNSDIVIIHDGARPMIKQNYINECIESINKVKGVTIGVKSKDTIKITDEDNIVINTTKRSNTWLIHTPQCFDRKILLRMHEKYDNEDITDDCMLLELDGYKVKIIEGDYTNIKITTKEDMNIIKEFI